MAEQYPIGLDNPQQLDTTKQASESAELLDNTDVKSVVDTFIVVKHTDNCYRFAIMIAILIIIVLILIFGTSINILVKILLSFAAMIAGYYVINVMC